MAVVAYDEDLLAPDFSLTPIAVNVITVDEELTQADRVDQHTKIWVAR